MRIKLIILNRNENFTLNFYNYINSRYRTSFSASAYTNLDLLVSQQTNHVDMLVVESEYYDTVKEVMNLTNIIVVLSHSGNLKEVYRDRHNINIFEESDSIIQHLLDIYQKEKKVVLEATDILTRKVIGFFSPIGGVGKTTLSIIFAKLLAKAGNEVLYLSLDHFINIDYYINGKEKEDLTFLFTTLEENSDVKRDIEYLKIEDSSYKNLHYIKGFEKYIDRLEVSYSLWEQFCEKLFQFKDYQYIVLDLPTDIDRKTNKLLDNVDTLLMIKGKTTVENIKYDAFSTYMSNMPFFNRLEQNDSVYLIYNNSRNVESNRVIEDEGFKKVDIGFDNMFKEYDSQKQILNLKDDTEIGQKLLEIVNSLSVEE